MKRIRTVAMGVAAIVAPVVVKAPAPARRSGPTTVAELIGRCEASGAEEEALVNVAIREVADAFPYYSLWHSWERPETALSHGRGWSHQYNTVLLLVLRGLGFQAEAVHAARGRGFKRPGGLAGHTRGKVLVRGRRLDACASRGDNRAGEPGFVPLTAELPLRRVTRWAVGVAVTPFVVTEIWRAWLTGRPVAPWVYGPRDTV